MEFNLNKLQKLKKLNRFINMFIIIHQFKYFENLPDNLIQM